MKARIFETCSVVRGKATAVGRAEATQASEEFAWRVAESKRRVPLGRSRERVRRGFFICDGDRRGRDSPLDLIGV